MYIVTTRKRRNQRRKRKPPEPSQTDYNTRKVHDLLSGVTLLSGEGVNPPTGPLCPLLTFSPRGRSSRNRSTVLHVHADTREEERERERRARKETHRLFFRFSGTVLGRGQKGYATMMRERKKKEAKRAVQTNRQGYGEQEREQEQEEVARYGGEKKNLTFVVPASMIYQAKERRKKERGEKDNGERIERRGRTG